MEKRLTSRGYVAIIYLFDAEGRLIGRSEPRECYGARARRVLAQGFLSESGGAQGIPAFVLLKIVGRTALDFHGPAYLKPVAQMAEATDLEARTLALYKDWESQRNAEHPRKVSG